MAPTTAPITKADIARVRMFGIRLPKPKPGPMPEPTPERASGRCSLTLSINGTPYRVRKLDAEFGKLRAFRLTKSDGEFHDVSDGVYGAECSCGSFIIGPCPDRMSYEAGSARNQALAGGNAA